MIALIQRVTEASVSIKGETIATIGPGMLVLVAIEHGDGPAELERMADRLLHFRLFADARGRMNLDITASGGELLLVPQFTLAADTDSGHRPGFALSAKPEPARVLFNQLASRIRDRGQSVATGQFGADMQVALINDGPVTFSLRVGPSKC